MSLNSLMQLTHKLHEYAKIQQNVYVLLMIKLFRFSPTTLLALFIQSSFAFGQSTVRGVITDLVTGETLPYVTVSVPGTTEVVSADDDGRYVIKVPITQTKIRFNYVGYLSIENEISSDKDQLINVKMDVDVTMLDDVVINIKRRRYRNRENPAVQLIRKVVERKEANRPMPTSSTPIT